MKYQYHELEILILSFYYNQNLIIVWMLSNSLFVKFCKIISNIYIYIYEQKT